MWTAFDYLYRDAGNFKAFGTVALQGRVSCGDQLAIRKRLESGEFFIAEQIGIPPLYEALYKWSKGPTATDHCWHEFVGFRECTCPPEGAGFSMPAQQFVDRFTAVTTWDGSLSPHFSIAT